MFLQCVSTVIIVYIIISPLNSYIFIHWILTLNKYYYYIKQILNYQMRSDVSSQNTIVCIRHIKNQCDNYHVSISVGDENINEDSF